MDQQSYFQNWFVFLSNKLDLILQRQSYLEQGEQKMALDISALQAAVAAETSADQSAITLLAQLTQEIQQIAVNSVDPATVTALNNLATQLQSNAKGLGDAVTANTPAPDTTLTTPAPDETPTTPAP